MIMMTLFLYMFSVLLVQQTASFLEEGGDLDRSPFLLHSFGSVQDCMITLLAATTGDGWRHGYETLLPIGGFSAAAYLFHMIFMQVAIVNIITGIFVDTAMKSMEGESEHKAMEHSREEQQREKGLRAICKSLDTGEEGRISKSDWDEAFEKSINQSFFELVGIRAHDVAEFFEMLMHSSEDQRVDIDEFVSGCMRLKGPASCFDTMTVISEVRNVKQELVEVLQILHVQQNRRPRQ
jgi:hypothetical protein